MDGAGHWIDTLFAAIDRQDTRAFAALLTEDARFVFANSAPVQGRAAIASAVDGFFAALRSLEHRLEARWLLPGVAIVIGEVTYTRHDGSTLQVPFSDLLKYRADGVYDYRIYIDVSRLFTP